MKKIALRILTALLTVLVILPLAACGKGTENDQSSTTTSAANASDPAVTTTENPYDAAGYLKDSLDPSVRFDGKTFNILYWNDQEHEEFFTENMTGDLINDALYTRNQAVEERMGIKFAYVGTKGNASNVAAFTQVINNSIQAGDHAYDLVGAHSYTIGNAASKNLLYNLNDCDYLDWEKPWWPAGLIDQATINDKLFFASGDISANVLYMMYVTFFNKQILEDFKLEDPYTLVDEGKWTIDKMFEMCSGIYSDLNGNGIKDIGDQYGQYAYTLHLDTFLTGSNVIIVDISSGKPVFSDDFLGEKVVNLQSKVRSFFTDSNDGYLLTVNSSVHQYFGQGISLFWNDRCRAAIRYFADKDISFGIIPDPKYDEEQENYVTCLGNPFTPYAIPSDSQTPDMAAAVMECMASESYRQVSPALYETALKLKYSQDNVSSRMFDTVRATLCFDLGRIYSSALGGPAGKWQSAITGTTAWTTIVKANSKVWAKQLDNLMASFN